MPTHKPAATGAIARPKDIRDWKIGHSQAPVQIPAVYMPDRSGIPVKMQGKYGTCGGHAGAALTSILDGIDLSPKFVWKNAKKLYGTPITEDGGVDMRSIFKAIKENGACHENLCPDILDATFSQYSDPASITDAMMNDAYPYGVDNYAFTDHPSWDQMKQAIYQNAAVIALVDCGSGWYANGWGESATCPLKLGRFDSGHFIVLWGYDEKYIYFRNSWSDAWGRKGDGYFDASYLSNVREIGVGVAAPSTKQKLVSLYTQLIFTAKALVAALLNKKSST